MQTPVNQSRATRLTFAARFPLPELRFIHVNMGKYHRGGRGQSKRTFSQPEGYRPTTKTRPSSSLASTNALPQIPSSLIPPIPHFGDRDVELGLSEAPSTVDFTPGSIAQVSVREEFDESKYFTFFEPSDSPPLTISTSDQSYARDADETDTVLTAPIEVKLPKRTERIIVLMVLSVPIFAFTLNYLGDHYLSQMFHVPELPLKPGEVQPSSKLDLPPFEPHEAHASQPKKTGKS